MALSKRIRSIILIVCGFVLIFLSYKLYESGKQKTYVQQHSPLVRMRIVERVNGLGTIRSPNKIYVFHQGRKYVLESSNKHFRRTARLDSIDVHFDPITDMAVLPGAGRMPYLLLIMIALIGFLIIGKALVDLRRKA